MTMWPEPDPRGRPGQGGEHRERLEGDLVGRHRDGVEVVEDPQRLEAERLGVDGPARPSRAQACGRRASRRTRPSSPGEPSPRPPCVASCLATSGRGDRSTSRWVDRRGSGRAAEPIIGAMESPRRSTRPITAHPDPEATAARTAGAVGLSCRSPSTGDGPPWWMTEMIAAEPASRADPAPPRRPAPQLGAPACRPAAAGRDSRPAARAAIRPRCEQGEPVGRDRLRHERARGPGAGGDPRATRAARAGLRGAAAAVAAQAFEASLAPAARRAVSSAISHEGGTGATIAALEAAARGRRADGGRDGQRRARRSGASTIVARDRGDRPRAGATRSATSSPILAAVAVGAAADGRADGRRRRRLIRALLDAGLGAATAAAEAIAGRAGRAARADPGHRLRAPIGPAGRELALKVEEATWLPATPARPRDVPPRPPARDGRGRPASS